MYSLLIATPDETWGKEIRIKLDGKGYSSEYVGNGRDCQIRISKCKFFAIILDFKLAGHSAFEVLKFIKTNSPSIKVLLLVKDKEELNANYLGRNSLTKAESLMSYMVFLPLIKFIKVLLLFMASLIGKA